MSKHDKTLARMRAKPTPTNVTWDEMSAALKHLGYKLLTNSGSRRKFYHREKDALIICHEPHPHSEVDKGCVVAVVEHLKANGFLGEDE